MSETANALAEPDQAGNWESARACQDARGRKARYIYFHGATGTPGNSESLTETEIEKNDSI